MPGTVLRKLARYARRHHVGLLALAVALSGTAYAVNSVGPRDIKRNAVMKRHLRHNSVGATELGKTVRFSKVVTIAEPGGAEEWSVGGGSVPCRFKTRAVGYDVHYVTGNEPRAIAAANLSERGFFAAGLYGGSGPAKLKITVVCLRK